MTVESRGDRNVIRAVAVLLTAGVAAGCSGSHETAVPPPGPTTTALATPAAAAGEGSVTRPDGRRLSSALLGQAMRPSDFLPGLTPQDAQLPAGSGLTLDVAHATVDGNLARVPATVTGSLAGDWSVLLARVDGTWRIYGTIRA